jgi:hypothetical protein
MADGHRPYCLARPTDDDKIVVDVEIAPDGRPYIERLP